MKQIEDNSKNIVANAKARKEKNTLRGFGFGLLAFREEE
jgi:hypothetical protein